MLWQTLPPLYSLTKEQQKVFLCFKTRFFLQSVHSCDPKSLLPLLLSPFPGFNQPSFSGPCASCCLLAVFFPVLILFSSLWIQTLQVLQRSDAVTPQSIYLSLHWKESVDSLERGCNCNFVDMHAFFTQLECFSICQLIVFIHRVHSCCHRELAAAGNTIKKSNLKIQCNMCPTPKSLQMASEHSGIFSS